MFRTRKISFVVALFASAFVTQLVHAQKMYWTDTFTRKVQRANLDGTLVEDLISSGLSNPRGIALDLPDGKVYWTDSGLNSISRANLDGNQVETLVTQAEGVSDPRNIALDIFAGKMYWVNRAGGEVLRANLDGSAIELLISSGLSTPFGLALDLPNGKMYVTDGGAVVKDIPQDGRILRADLDGSALEILIVGLLDPIDIALDLDAGEMYWTDTSALLISRSTLDGINVTDIVANGLSFPLGLALDIPDGKLYWTDGLSDTISRSNLDGSLIEVLVNVGLDNPRNIVLDIGICMIDTACSDGNSCTDDFCNNGVCNFIANSLNSCDDGNVCTDDVCSEGICVSTPNTSQCNDGNICTDDVCSEGICVGTPNTSQCSDGNVCTDDVCGGGICVSTPNHDACDDGDVCTDGICNGGVCVSTPNSINCDDSNDCTINDVCFDGDCLGENRTGPCDDGSICTAATECADGVCQGGATVIGACMAYSLLVTEVNGLPCPSCPTAILPSSEVLPGDRITIEAYVSEWGGPDGNRLMEANQWSLDISSLASGISGTLQPAKFSCTSDVDCQPPCEPVTQFACSESVCELEGFCDFHSSIFINSARPDYIYPDVFIAVVHPHLEWANISNLGLPVADNGMARYMGTLIVDASIGARGAFEIRFSDDPRLNFGHDEISRLIPAGTLNPVTINFCDVIDSPNDCNGNSIPDECEPDGDGDGVIDACDPCPLDALDDSDGDGVCDSDDGCPTNPLKIVPGDCGCSNPEDDSDGDGVPDCVDLCAGVDDAIFGEQCANAIPAVDSWGLIVLSLLLMVGGKLYFQRRPVSIHAR